MAKNKTVAESATLVSPKGTKVTVAKDSQKKYTDRGYLTEAQAKKAEADAAASQSQS